MQCRDEDAAPCGGGGCILGVRSQICSARNETETNTDGKKSERDTGLLSNAAGRKQGTAGVCVSRLCVCVCVCVCVTAVCVCVCVWAHPAGGAESYVTKTMAEVPGYPACQLGAAVESSISWAGMGAGYSPSCCVSLGK